MIRLTDVSKRYPGGRETALCGATMTIENGEFVFLVGQSGAGKSTLLRLLFREYLPTVPPSTRRMARSISTGNPCLFAAR